jgi:inhibitor of KinA
MTPPARVLLGDSCVALQFDAVIDPAVNARCIALAAALEQCALRGIRDIVPTYNTVTVHFDPLATDHQALERALEHLPVMTPETTTIEARTIELPVNYGGACGPDLPAVAEFAGCSEAEVVKLHTRLDYRVYMLGFLPGFAYMGSVDSRIAMPRLETPRMRVAAGSVGIAGSQTGIYPCDTPGGWRIIGQTSVKVFDETQSDPFLFKAGDRVRFVAG